MNLNPQCYLVLPWHLLLLLQHLVHSLSWPQISSSTYRFSDDLQLLHFFSMNLMRVLLDASSLRYDCSICSCQQTLFKSIAVEALGTKVCSTDSLGIVCSIGDRDADYLSSHSVGIERYISSVDKNLECMLVFFDRFVCFLCNNLQECWFSWRPYKKYRLVFMKSALLMHA